MDTMTPAACAERRKLMDERFARDKERLEDLERWQKETEERQQQLEKLSLQLGEMLKRNDERVIRHDVSLKEQGQRIGALEKYSVDKMEARIGALEQKSGKRWEKVVETALVAIVSAVVGAVISMVV